MAEAPQSPKKVSIDQIASALGVSKTTVSRALSGKGRISEATRARVRAYVQSTGATPAVRSAWPEDRATKNLTMVIPGTLSTWICPFCANAWGHLLDGGGAGL